MSSESQYTQGNLYSLSYLTNFKVLVTEKYFSFTGRATRGEYWRFVLTHAFLSLLIALCDIVYFGSGGIVPNVYNVLMILPNVGVHVRRLHDVERSGWWLLIECLPILGTLYIFFLALRSGTEGPNEYGEDPMPR